MRLERAPDQRRDQKACQWDIMSGDLVASFHPRGGRIHDVDLSHDGKWLAFAMNDAGPPQGDRSPPPKDPCDTRY